MTSRRFVTEEGGEEQRFTFAEMAEGNPADQDDGEVIARLDALDVGETAHFDIGGGTTWVRRVA